MGRWGVWCWSGGGEDSHPDDLAFRVFLFFLMGWWGVGVEDVGGTRFRL